VGVAVDLALLFEAEAVSGQVISDSRLIGEAPASECAPWFQSQSGHRNDLANRVWPALNRNIGRSVYFSKAKNPIVKSAQSSNLRLERSRGSVFVGPGWGSMIGIKQLRCSSAHSRVAQPHR
jgi:hypothetical protein